MGCASEDEESQQANQPNRNEIRPQDRKNLFVLILKDEACHATKILMQEFFMKGMKTNAGRKKRRLFQSFKKPLRI